MIRKRGTDSRPSKKGGRSRATSKAGSAGRRRAPQGADPRGTRSRKARPREDRPREEREAPERQVAGRKRRPVDERGKQPTRSAKQRQQRQQRQPRRVTAQMRAQRARRRWLLKRLGVGLIILLAVLSVMWLVSFSLKKIEEHTTPPDPAHAFDPIPCQADFLDTTITDTAGEAGKPLAINVKLKNARGSAPCVFETSPSDFSVKITSGDYTSYDSAACKQGVTASRLLIDKGLETTQTFTWDGKNSGSECTSGGPSQPGTYKAKVYYLGEPLVEDSHVFTLVPPAKPEEKPAQ